MHKIILDQNAASALLFGVLLIVVALRPRPGRRRDKVRGTVPAFVGTGRSKDSRGAGRGSTRLGFGSHTPSGARARLATPVWMMATLTLLCGVGAAGALMADASSYSTTITGDSPSIYYRLGESSGTAAADSSGNGYGATYATGVTLGANGAISGDTDTAVTSGTSGILTENSSSGLNIGANARSLEAWFKTSSATSQAIMGYGPSGNDFEVYITGGQLSLWNGSVGSITSALPYSPTDNTWHHVVATYDGNVTGTIYVDGQQVGKGSFSGQLADTSGHALTVGDDSYGNVFSGTIDEAAVYTSALTAAQVNAHWRVGLAATCPTVPSTGYAGTVHSDSPTRYYRLGETSGKVAADVSGNCLPGYYRSSATHDASGAITGDSDGAASLAGSGGDVMGSTSGLPVGANARTMEGWFKYAGASVAQPIAEYGSVSNRFELVYVNGSIEVYNGNKGAVDGTPPYSVIDGAWHYFAATYDGATSVSIYLDGQQIRQGNFTGALTDTADAPLTVGSDTYGNSLNGSVDEVAIYSTALSAARINAHWQAGRNVSCPATPSGSSYAGTVHSDSPEQFFRLNDSGAAVGDSSGHCREGVYTSVATHDAVGALVSDPAGSGVGPGTGVVAVGSGDGLPTGAGARTLEAWFKTTSTNLQSVVMYGPASNRFELYVDSGGVELYTATVGGVYATAAVEDGNWHQAVVTFDGTTTGKVYVDGVLKQTGTLSAGLNSPVGQPLRIGSDPWPNNFNGEIDDVAAYSSALSAARVTAHFNAGAAVGGALTAAQIASGMTKEMVCACAHGQSTSNPVDNATGNFWHSFTDVSLAGRGAPLNFSRNYNAQAAATNGPLGYGWTTNYGTTALAVVGSTATLTDEVGSQATFTLSGGVWSPSSPRFIATLVHNVDLTWTLVRFNRDTLTFDSSGNLTAQADLNGYTTSYAYTAGKLTTVTDQAARTLTITWTGSNITKVTDANVTPNRVVTYQYNDTFGNLTDVIDVRGNTQHFVYDTSHRMTVMKDPKCQALGAGCPGMQNTYDTSSRITIQKDQLNHETDFDYASIANATKVTDPKSNVTVTYYNQGLRVAETHGYGTASAATTHFGYDPSTLALTTIVDPNGHTTTLTVDSSGNVLTSTDPLSRVTTNTYNSFNELLTTQDPNGVTTTNTYDAKGNLTRTCRPLPSGSCGGTPSNAQVTTYNHTDNTHTGDVTSVVDPDSKTTTLTYDSYGNVASSSDPLANKTTITYDADSFRLTTVSPKGNVSGCGCAATYTTTNTNNAFGEVLTSTDPLSHVTTYTYDTDGKKATIKDPNTNQTTYTYDVANQITTITRPDTTTAVTDYNNDGTVLDQKDGKSNAILTYGYDSLARVTTVTDALSNVTTFTYDSAGNRLTQQDPGGNCGTSSKCTTTTYDVANQATAVTYSDGVTPNVTNIAYDSDGQRTGMTDGTGTSAWVIDNLHRVTSYSNGNSTAVTYAYNLRNLPTTITYPGSHAATNVYDDAGRMTSVKDWLGTPNTTSFGYDVNSNLTSDTLQSGAVDTYTFNAANQQTAISDVKGGTTIFAATYTRDSNGQLASDTSQAANQGSFKYTSLNQLCYAGSAPTNACSSAPANSYPYGFDTADNLTTMENAGHTGTNAQQFNTADELCWTVAGASANACGSAPTGATSFTFDNQGNRTSQVPNAGSATCTAFDQADRLTSVKTGTGSSCTTPTNVGSYAYDGSGMRQSKTVSGTTTQFLLSGSGSTQALLDEKAGSATPTYYLYGPGGRVIEQVDPSGSAHFYHCDQIGSIRAVTNSSGTTDATYTYDPYGNVGSSTNPGSITNPLQFQGQYVDSESGLYYLRARYYDPATAQFMSLDPMVATTMSPYAYVSGDPLNATDPSGMDGCSWYDAVCQAQAAATALAAQLAAAKAAASQVVSGVTNGAGSNLDSLKAGAKLAYQHVVFSSELCFGGCVNLTFQDGVVNLQGGGVGYEGKVLGVGLANLVPSQRSQWSAVAGYADEGGLQGSVGLSHGPQEGNLNLVGCNLNDWEVDVIGGEGGQFGSMVSMHQWQLLPSL